jgi:hypothetical protein
MHILGVVASSIIKSISDLFTRTTSGSLGTSTSGAVWNSLKGVWSANGTQAVSTDTANTYPIASVTLTSNTTASADVSGGTGLAFWITDSSNWWATYPSYVQNSTTASVCNAGYQTGLSSTATCCSGASSSTSALVCNGGYTTGLSSTATCCSSYTSQAGATTCTGGYTTGLASTGSCCSSATSSGGVTTCTGGYTTGLANTSTCCSSYSTQGGAVTCTGGYTTGLANTTSCCSAYTTTAGATTCTGTVRSCTDASNTCTPSGSNNSTCAISSVYTAATTTCTGAVAHCYTAACTPAGSCGAISETITRTCPDPIYYDLQFVGGSYGCYTIGYTVYSPGFQDTSHVPPDLAYDRYSATTVPVAAYYTRSRSDTVTTATTYACYTSNVTAPSTYSCYTSTVTSPVVYACYTSNVTAPTTYTCYTSYTGGVTTYACYTSTSSVTTYTYDTRIVVVSSVSGSVATDSTTTLVSGAGTLSPINSLKVNTTGNDITVTAYSSAGLVSALGSPVVRSISAPTRGTSVGIVKGPTAYNQGTTLDNFSAQA